jgi:hypothetical protein
MQTPVTCKASGFGDAALKGALDLREAIQQSAAQQSPWLQRHSELCSRPRHLLYGKPAATAAPDIGRIKPLT